MSKTFEKLVKHEWEFVKSEEETTKVQVASVNNNPDKIYIRTFVASERYTGPSKEGMSLTKSQALDLIDLLKAATEKL